MKTVILCGGMGTRIAEETQVRPKPMITVGGYPVLWHIMNIYGHYGFNDFILALGYKGEIIKEYFLNYHALNNDLEIDLSNGAVKYIHPTKRDWKVKLVDTGHSTLTGGRLKRLEPMLREEGTFCLTYGDGLANVDIKRLLEFHRSHGKLATVTSVRPIARFGEMILESNRVTHFKEKPQSGSGWINGGFFIFESKVFDYIKDDETVLEASPLERLASNGELMAYQHGGFWHCMDTIRDRQVLEGFWASKDVPWKVWQG